MENKAKDKKLSAVGGFLVMVAMCTGIFFRCSGPAEPEPTPVKHQIVYLNPETGIIDQVFEYLMNDLKDPDSYHSIGYGEIHTIKEGFDDKFKYKVWHKYEAANSFGANVTITQMFYFDKKGNIVDVETMNN